MDKFDSYQEEIKVNETKTKLEEERKKSIYQKFRRDLLVR